MTNLHGGGKNAGNFKSGIQSPRKVFPGGSIETPDLHLFDELFKPPNLRPDHIYVNEKAMENVKQIYRN